MKLIDGKIGETYRLCSVSADEKITSRIEALGMNDGTLIKLLNKKRHGAVIVSVRGSRLALGLAIAERIEVEHE